MQQRYRRIKRSFTAGEVSPYLEGRTGADTFINGCRMLKNMVVLPEGPVVRRPGFEYFTNAGLLGTIYSAPIFFEGTDGYQYILAIGYTSGLAPVLGIITVYDPTGATAAGSISTYTWSGVAWYTDYAIIGDEIYITDGETPLQLIIYNGPGSWTITAPTLVGAPFSSSYGYPYYVFFHQQRLGLARTKTRPQGVWLSKVNDFYEFTLGTAADDPVSFQLDSDVNSKIQWISSGRSLFIGTDDDEWTVRGGGTTQLITPTSVLAQRHTNIGSKEIHALRVAHTLIFIEQLGRAIYELLYDYYADSYTTNDLIILSKHLTEQYKIVSWTYQQVPHHLIWAVREDGILLTLTYQREHKVIGWAQHEVRDVVGDRINCKQIISGRWTDFANEHVIWIVSSTQRFYALAPWAYTNPSAQYNYHEISNYVFLDDAERHYGWGFTTITVKHFNSGDRVSVLTDKGIHPDVIVIGSTITLNYPCYMVILGKNYKSEVRPIAIDINTQEGTTIGATQQIVELDLILYQTQGLYLTRFNESGEEAQTEYLSFFDPSIIEFPDLFSGHYIYSFPEGYNYQADYALIQQDPLPFMLVGIIETVKVL